MKNLTFYNITDQFIELMNKVEEGELTEEEYSEYGEKLALELKSKSTNILAHIFNKKLFIEGLDTQIKRMQDLKKSEEAKLDNFKKYVEQNMKKLGLQKLETEIGILSIAKSPISVEITDEDKIPNKYKKIIQTTSIDKTAIKDEFKETGEIVEGVKINTGNTYLKIK